MKLSEDTDFVVLLDWADIIRKMMVVITLVVWFTSTALGGIFQIKAKGNSSLKVNRFDDETKKQAFELYDNVDADFFQFSLTRPLSPL